MNFCVLEAKTKYYFPYDRYMAILSVLDDTGTSAFLGFDMKVTKMTGIEASEAAQIVV